jgi:hypothetical protein
MSREMICFIGNPETSHVLQGVRDYITNGLPEDSWFRDCSMEHDIKMPKKIWYDYNSHTGKHEYSDFRNADVLHAARFRDGLVADREIFPEFHNSLNTIWSLAYKQKSTIVFRHINKEFCESIDAPPCPSGAHKGLENGFCDTMEYEIQLMSYHIDNVEGQQSQSYMRFKVFQMLEDHIQQLPTDPYNSKKVAAATNCKYLHALAVVLYTLVHYEIWMDCKVYGADDFLSYFDATKRIHSTLYRLIRDSVFDDKELYKTFIRFHQMVKSIDEFNNRYENMFEEEGCKQTRFFPKNSLKKYEVLEKELCAKYGVWPTEADKKRERQENGEEEEDDEEDDEDEEDVIVIDDKEKASVVAIETSQPVTSVIAPTPVAEKATTTVAKRASSSSSSSSDKPVPSKRSKK